jgi:hypothetical protein
VYYTDAASTTSVRFPGPGEGGRGWEEGGREEPRGAEGNGAADRGGKGSRREGRGAYIESE